MNSLKLKELKAHVANLAEMKKVINKEYEKTCKALSREVELPYEEKLEDGRKLMSLERQDLGKVIDFLLDSDSKITFMGAKVAKQWTNQSLPEGIEIPDDIRGDQMGMVELGLKHIKFMPVRNQIMFHRWKKQLDVNGSKLTVGQINLLTKVLKETAVPKF